MKIIHMLVEGQLDKNAATRIIQESGHTPGICYGEKGCLYIKDKIQGFNSAAAGTYFLTLVDFMDTKCSCSPEVIDLWLPNQARHPNMVFRVVEREIESWILADRDNLSQFLNVNIIHIPTNPETIDDPKRTLVNIARKSRSKKVREALVPDDNVTAQVGKLYTWEMSRFIQDYWNLHTARLTAKSLEKCLFRLENL